MKIRFILWFLIASIASSVVISRNIVSKNKRRKHLSYDGGDYEASGDYFEVATEVVTTTEHARATTLTSAIMPSLVEEGSGSGEGESEAFTTSTMSSESSSTEGSDINDTDTCTSSNFTQIFKQYELNNHVLAIFKVNVSANIRELFFFLHLAKRFNLSEFQRDFKFVIICSDQSSDAVIEYMESENFPSEIVVVVDEAENSPQNFGMSLELEDLHVYILDQCGRLAFIVAPPWSSAEYQYVKAGLLSCFFDLPCACPANEFISSKLAEEKSSEYDGSLEYSDEPRITPLEDFGVDDIENIEEILHNSNSLADNGNRSTFVFEELIPLKIVIPSLHVHFDNRTSTHWLYDNIVIKTGSHKSPYQHFHLKSGVRVLKVRQNITGNNTQNNNLESISSVNLTKLDSEMFVGNRTIKDIWTIAQSDQIFIDRNGRVYKIQKEIPNGFEVARVDFDVVRIRTFPQNYDTREHYKQLLKWKHTVI